MMNQTQLVRSAINLFIVIAIFISLFQQLSSFSSQPTIPQPQTVTTPEGETLPLQPTGPIVPGIKILSTDKFTHPLKQLLAKQKINVQITSYTFEGNLYWMNMLFNWGHIILIYFLMSKYKMETDDGAKKKIMIGGALAVMVWFYVSAQFKPQALAVEVHGSKVYDKDYLNQNEVIEILNEYEIEIDDLNEAAGKMGTQKVDVWEEKQKASNQKVKVETHEEQIYVEEEVF